MLRRFALTVVLPGIILLGFGLRALQQDRVATDQQVRDRLERAAEFAARAVDEQLAHSQQFRSLGVVLETEPVLKVTPSKSFAYQPGPTRVLDEIPEPLLADAEQQEQVRGDTEAAILLYSRAAASGDSHVRVVALARLGICYQKIGRPDKAAHAFRELLQFPHEQIAARSADLIARFELASLGEADGTAFFHDLVEGQWTLDKARYLFYSDAAHEWVSEADPKRNVEREKLAVSAAVDRYLESPRTFLDDHIAFKQETETLIVPTAVVLSKLEHSANIDQEIDIRLVKDRDSAASVAFHALNNRELPWVVEAVPADVGRLYAGANQRRRVYMSILLFVFALMIVGSYFTARTVRRELEVARLKSDFVSTVSHEFRSPLTAIRQLSELLQRGRVPTEEKRQEYYALISRESGRLSRLIENLLDFSRIENGRKQYHFDRFDTAHWLQDLVAGFNKSTVTLSIAPELPPLVGDRMALTSAVDNLLDNAVKYSPPGAPVVCEAEVANHELIIRVRDCGYGIAPEDRDHVFEKFYRGRGDISGRVKGAGVGLSLVHQIVQAHGGRVDFDSCVGKGTIFRIRLKTA